MANKDQFLNVGAIKILSVFLQGIVQVIAGDGIDFTVVNTDDEQSLTISAEGFGIQNISSNYTVLDADDFIFVDASGGAVTVTLQAVTARTRNRSITVKRTDTSANAITILPDGSDLIEGDPSLVFGAGGRPAAELTPDTVSNWWIT